MLFLSSAEVALILWSGRAFGAPTTFCLVIGHAIAGLLIQWVRWHRLEPLRDELRRHSERVRQLSAKDADLARKYSKSAKGKRSVLFFAVLTHWWIATILHVLPGFLFHLLGFMSIVPVTRDAAFWILTCGNGHIP